MSVGDPAPGCGPERSLNASLDIGKGGIKRFCSSRSSLHVRVSLVQPSSSHLVSTHVGLYNSIMMLKVSLDETGRNSEAESGLRAAIRQIRTAKRIVVVCGELRL